MTLTIRLGYGVGQAADGIKTAVFTFFIFFYYNQVLGLAGWMTGLALALALVIDAIFDPMVGTISDRFRSRWGRRHPFMLAGVLPFAIAMYGLCNPPDGLNNGGLFAWLLGTDIMVRLGLTLFCVPHLSLGAEMERDYHARTRLIGLRTALSFLGQLVVTMVGFLVFFKASEEFTNGMQNAARYPSFGVFVALLGSGCMLIAISSTWRLIPSLVVQPIRASRGNPLLAFVHMFRTLQQKSFRVLIITTVAFMVVAGVGNTLLLYVGTFIFEFDEKQMGVLILSLLPAALLAPSFASWLSGRVEKRNALAFCVGAGASISSLPYWLYFGGFWQVMPIDQRILAILVIYIAMNVCFIAFLILLDSMLTDTIDERELQAGERNEGLFFGAKAFATKTAYGIGAFLAGLALDLIQFPTQSGLAQVATESVFNLAVLAGPVLTTLFLLTIFLIRPYALNAQRHQDILSAIEIRHTPHQLKSEDKHAD
ncbi:MAG: MFS transporter [Oceanococcus sp.]